MSFEEAFTTACNNQDITGGVLMATDASGNFTYEKAFGLKSTRDGAKPFDKDTVMSIASCTKLLTVIAVLQCVEQGLFTLDEDISRVLPELGSVKILSFDASDEPVLTAKKNAVTLIRLVTHSSGLTHEHLNPRLQKYHKSIGRTLFSGTDVTTRSNTPLVFEPGTSWGYSPGIDWAGLAVERVTGLSLEQYMSENMFAPLGIEDATFWARKKPEFADRLAEISIRDPVSGKAVVNKGPVYLDGITGCLGGAGIFTSTSSYMKVMISILADDGKLLKSPTAAQLFEPSLSEESAAALQKILESSELVQRCFGRNIPVTTPKDHGLGGIMNMKAVDGLRGERTIAWAGATHPIWFIDRSRGLCGMMGVQLMPFGDKKLLELWEAWEHGLHRLHEEWKTKNGLQ